MKVDVTFPFRKVDALGQPEGDFLEVGKSVELDDAFAQQKIADGHAVESDSSASRSKRSGDQA